MLTFLHAWCRLSGDDYVLGSYAHGGPSRAAGRIGSLVALHVKGACVQQPPAVVRHPALTPVWCASRAPCADAASLNGAAQKEVEQLAGQVAMHVAAIQPKFLSAADVPAAAMKAERDAFEAQARRSAGKSHFLLVTGAFVAAGCRVWQARQYRGQDGAGLAAQVVRGCRCLQEALAKRLTAVCAQAKRGVPAAAAVCYERCHDG
jgi:hypothetical protein